MGAAGHDPHGQVHPLGHQQVGGGNQRLRVGGVVKHFQLAIVHVDAGIPPDVGPGDHFQHLAGGNPEAGAQAGGPLEHMVVGGHGVHGHQPAHGGTGNDGVAAVGQGAVILVDVGLQLLDHPVHVNIALAPNFSQGGIFVVQGGVLHQAAVPLVVAFHGHDDQVFLALHHEFVHAPGFAVGGILVEKHIVPIEHIHHGIAAVGIFFIGFRQIDVSGAGGISGQFGNGHIPLFDHDPDLLFPYLVIVI